MRDIDWKQVKFFSILILLGLVIVVTVLMASLPALKLFAHATYRLLSYILNIIIDNRAIIRDFLYIIATLGSLVAFGPKIIDTLRSRRHRHLLFKRIGAESYTAEDLVEATTNYVEPDLQESDPGAKSEKHIKRHHAFKYFEKLTSKPSRHKYWIVLADTGMGKTAFLLNCYVRFVWKFISLRKCQLFLFHLGRKNIDSQIAAIEQKANTILLLDALDEDTKAVKNHRARLESLSPVLQEFRQVIITCRTQFFGSDEEIPIETADVKLGVVPITDSKAHKFSKVYLAPFSERQVKRYLRRRFRIWRLKERRMALRIVAKIPDLTARPLILTFIDYLLDSAGEWHYAADIYEELVKHWLIREASHIRPDDLLKFSEVLAVEIFIHRQSRGSEEVSQEELSDIFAKLRIPPPHQNVYRRRSLLTRTPDGKVRFAHRSLMEYLFIRRFCRYGEAAVTTIGWTDQMQRFWWDKVCSARGLTTPTKGVNLDGCEKLGLQAIVDPNEGKDLAPEKWKPRRRLSDRFVYPLDSEDDLLPQTSDTYAPVWIEKWPVLLHEICVDNPLQNREPRNRVAARARRLLGRDHNLDQYDIEASHLKILYDLWAGLMWVSDCNQEMDWRSASAYTKLLASVHFGGFGDWRLPTWPEVMRLLHCKTEARPIWLSHIGRKEVVTKKNNYIYVRERRAAFVMYSDGEMGPSFLDKQRAVYAVRNVPRS